MNQLDKIKELLKNGLTILNNVDDPANKIPKTMEYIDEGYKNLKEAGILIAAINPDLSDMIDFVHEHVDEADHCKINHGFSGIADWRC